MSDRQPELTHRNLAKRTHEMQENRAIRDSLTGLYNKGYLERKLEELTSVPLGSRFAFILLDLDNFKSKINDVYGHPFGDLVLSISAKRLKDAVRFWRIDEGKIKNDLVFRYGGEEFAFIIDEVSDLDKAMQIAGRLRTSLSERPIEAPDGEVVKVTGSVGVGVWDGKEKGKLLISRVDNVMYDAKHMGKDRVASSY